MKGDKKTKRKSPRPPGVRKVHRNITEAVQSRAERQQSSELHRTIIASATEGICACHDVPEFPYVRFTVWNDRMTEITGYSMKEINTSGWYQTVYPDPGVQARAKARMDRMRQGDNLNQEEWEITRKDGQKRQILISTRIVPGGETGVNILAVMNDITERKKLEEEIHSRAIELAALNAFGQQVNAALVFEEVSDAALKGIMNTVYPDLTFLFLRDGEKLILKGVESTKPGRWLEETPEHCVGECLCGLAARERKPIYSRNIFIDDRCTWEECKKAGFLSFAAIPLLSGPEVKGIVGMASYEERDFQTQAKFLETLVSQAAIALEKSRLFEQVKNELSERRRAEEALRRSETRLLATLENTPNVAVQWYDEAGRVQYWNKASEILYGWKADEAIGKTLDALIHTPDEAAEFLRILSSIRETGNPFGPYEAQIHHRDGTPGWVVATTFSIPMGEGRTTFVCMDVDITERKQTEEKLRESEGRFRAIALNTPDHIIIQDLDLRYVFVVNHQLGLTDADMIGKTDRELPGITAEDAEKLTAIKKAVLETGKPCSREIQIKNLKGETEHFEGTYTPKFDSEGNVNGLIGYFHNITERKRAEEALRESEDRYRDLVEHSHDLLCTHDLEGKLLSANPAALEISGYSKNELLGRNIRDLLAPEFRGQFGNYLTEIQAKGAASGVMLVQTKGGEKRLWEYHNTLRTEGLAVPIVRGMARDITEQKQTEKALQDSENRYRTLVENSNPKFPRKNGLKMELSCWILKGNRLQLVCQMCPCKDTFFS